MPLLSGIKTTENEIKELESKNKLYFRQVNNVAAKDEK